MYKILGIGHRYLENEKETKEFIREALDYFERVHGEIVCVSHLAAGADTWFIEEAVRKNFKIELVLPFNVEEYRKDFDNGSFAIFETILSKYPHTVHSTLPDASQETRNNAYLNVGLYNVDHCDAVLAIWDGLETQGKGGTADIVNYAISKGKELHWILGERKGTTYFNSNKSNSILKEFAVADRTAIFYKSRYHCIWSLGLISGIFAVFCFSINYNFIPKNFTLLKFLLSIGEIIFIGISFLHLGISANRLKKRFIELRKNAEELRAKIWNNVLAEFKRLNAIQQHGQPEIDYELLNLKRTLWTFTSSQITYQQGRIKKYKKALQIIHTYLSVLKYSFLLVVIGIAGIEGYHWLHHTENTHIASAVPLESILVFFWMLIPPMFASLEGVIYFNDWKKNIFNSKELVGFYEHMQQQIVAEANNENLLLIKNKIYNKFTFEVDSWIKEQEQKELETKI